ncbi:MAG: phosphoribosylanthranilate isomerase [Gammaproteobacteria bacterium]
MRTRVKICGITRDQDARAACACGADAIGLVFYAVSPRAVSVEQAGQISRQLPAFVTSVGLFVNPHAEEVEDVLAQVPLDCLQFHGEESAAFCEQFGRPYIKAIRVSEDTDILQQAQTYSAARAILLDAYVPDIPGGTGQHFDWSRIPPDVPKPVILAGGLTPDNVAEAIRQVQPYAVDVSGGVEQGKGIKDQVKIEQFIAEVNSIGAGKTN